MTWQEALDQYFKQLPEAQQSWLRKHVVLDAPLLNDLPDVSALVALFPFGSHLSHTAMLKTFVWQKLGQVLSGEHDPIDGNIRGFWYQHTDPFYVHFKLYEQVKLSSAEFKPIVANLRADLECKELFLRGTDEQIKKASVIDLNQGVIQDFVLAQIFKYSGPFKFKDSKSGQALVGRGTASIILYCEKEGLFEFIRKAYDEQKISVYCSNGSPSSLSIEYFSEQLKAKKIENVALGTLVDYDPSGYIIAKTFTQKMKDFGFGIRSSTMLTSLSLFTENALVNGSSELDDSNHQKSKNNAWFALTGGINGQRRCIHINQASRPRIRKAWIEWIEKEKEHG